MLELSFQLFILFHKDWYVVLPVIRPSGLELDQSFRPISRQLHIPSDTIGVKVVDFFLLLNWLLVIERLVEDPTGQLLFLLELLVTLLNLFVELLVPTSLLFNLLFGFLDLNFDCVLDLPAGSMLILVLRVLVSLNPIRSSFAWDWLIMLLYRLLSQCHYVVGWNLKGCGHRRLHYSVVGIILIFFLDTFSLQDHLKLVSRFDWVKCDYFIGARDKSWVILVSLIITEVKVFLAWLAILVQRWELPFEVVGS